MKKNKKTNPNLVRLIQDLKKKSNENDAPIWRDIAKRLEKPSRNWAEVNLSTISRYAKDEDVIIVPGKLLGAGDVSIKVTVAAFKLSRTAEEKIKKAGGKNMTIMELVELNPKGTGVRIMG